MDDAAKYFTDSKAVIVKLREWLPEYRKTGRFLEKRKWVEDLCSDGRLDVACVRASAMKEDSQSYSNVYKAITIWSYPPKTLSLPRILKEPLYEKTHRDDNGADGAGDSGGWGAGS